MLPPLWPVRASVEGTGPKQSRNAPLSALRVTIAPFGGRSGAPVHELSWVTTPRLRSSTSSAGGVGPRLAFAALVAGLIASVLGYAALAWLLLRWAVLGLTG